MPRTIKIDTAGHWLRADAAASYLRMLAAGMPSGGVDVFGRTMAEQQAVYDRYRRGEGPLAAKPSKTAPHIDGRAFDTHTTTAGRYAPSAAHVWLTKGGDGSSKPKPGEKLQAHTYGWRRSVPSERWHFEYDRAKDIRRAADLKARLKVLGYKDLKAFQTAHKLTPDGLDGPLTWGALLSNPTPAPKPAPPKEVPAVAGRFKAASVNVEAKRWGGGVYKDDAALITRLDPDVLMTQESDEQARGVIVAKTTMAVWPHRYMAVLWRRSLFDHGPKLILSLATPIHGGVATQLTPKDGAAPFVVASVHIRPSDALSGSDAAIIRAKEADIAAVIRWLAKYPRVMVGGDWNTSHARTLMLAAGYRLATPWEATTDKGAKLDGIYVRGIDFADGKIVPTSASDHHALTATITLPN